MALAILPLVLGVALVFGQGGSGRAPQNGSGRGDANKAKPAATKPRGRFTVTLDASRSELKSLKYWDYKNDEKAAVPDAARIASLCSRRAKDLTAYERQQLDRVVRVTEAPSNDPACKELLITRDHCKEWIDMIDAPLGAIESCLNQSGLQINEYDTVFTQMWFRDYLKQRQRGRGKR